jgi:hypothetical protein
MTESRDLSTKPGQLQARVLQAPIADGSRVEKDRSRCALLGSALAWPPETKQVATIPGTVARQGAGSARS